MSGQAIPWEELQRQVGLKRRTAKTITDAEMFAYATITGNMARIHTDEEFCRTQTPYGGRLVNGPLVAALATRPLEEIMEILGLNNVLVSNRARFLAPTRVGDTVTAEAELVEVLPEKGRIRIATRCYRSDGTQVAEGEIVQKVIGVVDYR